MKKEVLVLLFAATMLIGCAVEEGTYPSGAPCDPDDPVHELSTLDCPPNV